MRPASRRLAIAIGVLALAGGMLWLALPSGVAWLVEGRLAAAGFANATVAGVTVRPGGLDIERLRFSGDGAFVADDIRVRRAGTSVAGITIGRLHLQAGVADDGDVDLPGFVPQPATGSQVDLQDLIPADGIAVSAADIRLTTPWRVIAVTLADASMQRDPAGAAVAAAFAIRDATTAGTDPPAFTIDGLAAATIAREAAIDVELEIGAGTIDTAGVQAEGLIGAAVVRLPPRGSPALPAPGSPGVTPGLTGRVPARVELELELATADTRLAGLVFGPIALAATLHEDVAEIDMTSSGQAVELDVNARAALTDTGPLIDLTGHAVFPSPNSGELTVELSGVSLAQATARGRLQLTGTGLVIPGLLRDGAIDAAAVVAGNRERLEFSAADPWTATFVPVDTALPAALRGLADLPATVTAAARPGEPFELVMAWSERTATLDAAVEARSGRSRFTAAADFAADWVNRLTVTANDLTLSVAELPFEALRLSLERFAGRARYQAAQWEVAGAGTLRAAGALGDVDVRGLAVQWSGALSATPEGFTARADDCLNWSVERIRQETVQVDGLAAPCIAAAGADLVAWDAASGRVSFAALSAAGPVQARIAHTVDDDEAATAQVREYTLAGRWRELRVAGGVGGTAGPDLAVELGGASIDVAGSELAVAELDGAADVRGGELRTLRLNAGTLESRADPQWWAPVTVEVLAERRGGALAFESFVSDALGSFVLQATGQARAENGSADIVLHPVQLISGATELGDISPWLAAVVVDASGGVGFAGELAWGNAGLRSAGTLSLEDFAATVAGMPVGGVTAETRFTSLWPLVTAPEQSARIGELLLGMPLENGQVVFDLDAGPRLAVHTLGFDIAGGRIESAAFTVDSAAQDDIELQLTVADVELSSMLELSKINGLQGTGRMSGRIPVRIAAGAVQLEDGRLAAEAPGTLRYTPSELPAFLRGEDQRTQMLREALTNFEYDSLSVTVSGESGEGGQQSVRFDALGANPDFLGGHPIELAFTFNGPLLGAMSSAVSVTGAAEIDNLAELQQLDNAENAR